MAKIKPWLFFALKAFVFLVILNFVLSLLGSNVQSWITNPLGNLWAKFKPAPATAPAAAAA